MDGWILSDFWCLDPDDLKSKNFHESHMHVMSPVQQVSLEYRKAYIQHI